jgi:putative acetyltransferase
MEKAMTLIIRPEQQGDEPAIHIVHQRAFSSPGEAGLVAALRADHALIVSLVGVVEGAITGHIVFSTVAIQPANGKGKALALGPLAVLPEHQNKGIGKALSHAGLDACRDLGFEIVTVLGHPSYYPLFAFERASQYGITCEFTVPDEAFMVLELLPGTLSTYRGTIHYHPAFQTV